MQDEDKDNNQNTGNASTAATLNTATQTNHPKTQSVTLTHTELQEFQTDILHLFVANNFALHAIDSIQTRLFFEKWLPGPDLPTRQALGGRILGAAVQKAKEHTLSSVKCKMAVGMSDGWKNIRKTSLLACMINVDYTVSYLVLFDIIQLIIYSFKAYTVDIKDISALRKTAENHLKVVKEAIAYCEEKLETKIIGWVSDAGGESRAMRVRLFKERPDLILLDCYAHQVCTF